MGIPEWKLRMNPEMSKAHLSLFRALVDDYNVQTEHKLILKNFDHRHPITQVSLDILLLDFGVAIEVDGPRHKSKYDRARDEAVLIQHGIKTWRYSTNIIENDLDIVLELINLKLNTKSPILFDRINDSLTDLEGV